MSREIKFRAWEKNLKEMIPVHEINFENRMINIKSAWRLFDEIELMQFTGLKDSAVCEEFPEGIEIFESDILYDIVNNEFYIVAWDDNYAMFFLKNVNDDPKKDDYDFAEFDTEVCNNLYVVGNIYENPELLAGDN
ncbi:YopX family protein [Bacillus sp. FJAT-29814]|uniref:YopX family protein n=1 Tax=Bacillus sp. FJAT-29814 TaxID=1729688 RepID=UPI000833DFB4|nr:YopX family protein [Bacillus sp. FJAT-29814]